MPLAGKHLLIVVTLACVTFFTNLGGPRLWDRDEPRNAGCAVEMLERNDWVVPVFNAELRIHKPVLLYWFMMAAYGVFGENEFGARFFSALLAVGTVSMTYAMGRRMFNAQAGLWAAVILSTTLMFNVAARAATPDSVLIFFSTLALCIYVFSVPWNSEAPANELFPRRWLTAAAMYAVMGIAILAKGPVGLVLPTAVIGMYLLIRRLPEQPAVVDGQPYGIIARAKQVATACARPFAPFHFLSTCWQMRLLTATVVGLLVAAPWYIWVGLRTDGAWLEGFFIEHNVQRTTTAMEGHSGSILYYPLATLLGFFPWSIFAVPVLLDSLRAIRGRERWSAGYLFSLCWAGVFIGLFSIARTKLPSYVTPMYPGLALATGAFVARWNQREAQVASYWPRVSFDCLMGAAVATVIGLAIALHLFTPGAEYLAAVGVIPLAAGAAAYMFYAREQRLAATNSVAAGAASLMLAMFAFAADQVDEHRYDHLLFAAIEENNPQAEVVGYRQFESSWVFYLGQPIAMLPDDSPRRAAEYLAGHRNGYVITDHKYSQEILSALPPTVQVLAEIPKFLESERVVVIGRPAKGSYVAKRVEDVRPLR